MNITWLGTASFLFETEKARVLFDPFVELVGGTNPNTIEDFLGEDAIFITHGHFDHLFFVPDILENSEATVFCTQVQAQSLEKMTDCTGQIARFEVGQEIPIGDMRIRSYKGKHIVFDRRLILDTITPARMLRFWRNLPFLAYANKNFPEGDETICYLLESEGRRILLLGSLNLDKETAYPTDVDLLVLPYQGSTDLPGEADPILERIRPRCVLLSHFDNAFPPLSRDVDLRGFKRLIAQKYPQIHVVKPVRGKRMTLAPACR